MKQFLIICLLAITYTSAYAQEPIKEKSVLENPKKFKDILAKTNVWGKEIFIGYSKKKQPIYAYYYNTGGTDKAMVIAGVHGSEFFGVDVARSLMDSLKNLKIKKSKWKILIVPEVFPDNVIIGRECPFKINCGRETCVDCLNPNRQMPKAGKLFTKSDSLDHHNRPIEIENQYLLTITQIFNPSRIASVHCKNGISSWLPQDIRDNYKDIGIYADPRRDENGIALGFAEDAILAIKMAFIVKENNGYIYGNFRDEDGTTSNTLNKYFYLNPIYPSDSAFALISEFQPKVVKNGISYGDWASTQIKKENIIIKKAASTITLELPQNYVFYSKKDDLTSRNDIAFFRNIKAYTKSLKESFLDLK